MRGAIMDKATAATHRTALERAREQLTALEASNQEEANFRKAQAEANIPKLIAARKAMGSHRR
jgi:hypothetical protein